MAAMIFKGPSQWGSVSGGNAGKVRKHKSDASLFVLDLNVHFGAWHQLGNPSAARAGDILIEVGDSSTA